MLPPLNKVSQIHWELFGCLNFAGTIKKKSLAREEIFKFTVGNDKRKTFALARAIILFLCHYILRPFTILDFVFLSFHTTKSLIIISVIFFILQWRELVEHIIIISLGHKTPRLWTYLWMLNNYLH